MGEEERLRAIDAGIRWTSAVLLQVARLHEVEAQLEPTPGDVPHDYSDAERQGFHRLRTEAHFCLVAARQLLRAIDYLKAVAGAEVNEEALLPADVARRVRVLRDCFEHWTEQNAVAKSGRDPTGRAYRQWAEDFPDEDPGTYEFGAGGTKIAGLSLDALEDHARSVRAYLLKLEATSFVWKGWEWR